MDWKLSLVGLLIGALVGTTGMGGGSLMTPILVLLFGIAPAAAVGTDLWFAALTKMVGGTVHQHHGGVDWQVFRRLAFGSLPAAAVTLWWLHATGASQIRSGFLLHALGGVLILTAVAMLFRGRIHDFGRSLRGSTPDRFKRAQPALTVFAGATLGVLVTLTGSIK